MKPNDLTKGKAELCAARSESRRLFLTVGIFSFFVNLLMLTGPLYMLQVYDRVLGSRSDATLLALTLLMAFLFLVMGVLDYARGRVLSRIGARFQSRLDRRVFSAEIRRAAVSSERDEGQNALRDLESVQKFLSAPILAALFDLPWTPFFLLVIYIFHPWLGILATVGGVILIGVALLNQTSTKRSTGEASHKSHQADRMSDQIRSEAEMVRSLGMQDAAFSRWQSVRSTALGSSVTGGDLVGGYSAVTKTFRMFLQSAMLGLGALLVLQGDMTGGGMIAASIMLGRALAPIDLAVGQWPVAQRAMQGWQRLAVLLSTVPEEPQRVALPRPQARLTAEQVTVIPPGEGQATLRMISFDVRAGEAVGVIGPSGAGKSTLARAITGVWRAAGGKIRLGGAALDQYEPDVLGRHIGYLPQRVQLFDGTIAENIARLSPDMDDEAVVTAARKAAAHEMILKLPDGYNTQVSSAGGRLSGGQIQRVGLARAMYGDPVLMVLDEPNSNLDAAGTAALNEAVAVHKKNGGAVLIMAHRPAAIQLCERVLYLDGGIRRAFGPTNEVLREALENHKDLAVGKDTAKGALT